MAGQRYEAEVTRRIYLTPSVCSMPEHPGPIRAVRPEVLPALRLPGATQNPAVFGSAYTSTLFR